MDNLSLSDIKKAIQAVKRDKWRDDRTIMSIVEIFLA